MMRSATAIMDQKEQDLQSEEAKCVRGQEGEREGTRLCQENFVRLSASVSFRLARKYVAVASHITSDQQKRRHQT
jgi:hypothetical protein